MPLINFEKIKISCKKGLFLCILRTIKNSTLHKSQYLHYEKNSF